ncbi:ankyrin repeat domain-containing protein [Streptomyces sp. MB09-01]|uniref:ankyrin repeat domain-containing protein n=1 Tax=Streptomyces sp. MB09-01 TaxID=3028666 RepID=UPI0029A133D4|nr:ankyrin repeat domain-containing protein [Streptomyces sp. MB09-01]MDX3536319.1 ankyrin repeat domain-containing protein [Streptomyces sp. MB09-01]
MTGLDVRLAAAVRVGDAEEVRALIEAGADPDAADTDGLPVLCAAVQAFAHEVAETLVEGGADPDRQLPDGTTPLLRAVEGGSPATVSAVNRGALRLPQEQRERLLATARHWYETGAETELRRRTGVQGPARTGRVQDGEYLHVDTVTLGGWTVRAGHGAVLTDLEQELRIPTPVEELVARAVRHADDHVDWSASCWALASRRSAETWSQVLAFHRHPSPVHRAFVLDFLGYGAVQAGLSMHARWYERERGRLLASWAQTETDGGVLADVLALMSREENPDAPAIGLRHAGHPDPRVRREVPALFDPPWTGTAATALRVLASDSEPAVRAAAADALGRPEVWSGEDRELLVSLFRDPDPQVRSTASYAVASGRDRSPAVTEALFGLLAADEQMMRLNGAFGLALRDDPRTPEAYGRVGPQGREYEHDHRWDGLWRWSIRNERDYD